MKRLFVMLTVAFILATGSVFAQPNNGRGAGYQVVQGDNLWDLAGAKLNDPFLWKKVYDANPFLHEPGRVIDKDGRTIVIVRKGEVLQGLEALGILPKPISLAELNVPVPSPTTVVVETTPAWAKVLLWSVIALIILAVIAYLILRSVLKRDPVTSRPPVVRGGVDDSTAASRFQSTASRLYPTQQFTIVEQTPGQIYGTMNVRYGDGREMPRELTGQRAYRAQVRFSNGREETLYMLQACGNDLRFGGISRYIPGATFRFEPEVAATNLPTTATETDNSVAEPISEEPAAVEETAVATAAIPESNGNGSGEIKIEFRTAKAERRNGHRGQQSHNSDNNDMVRISGIEVDSFTFIKNGRDTTFRFQPIRPSKQTASV